MSEYAREKGDEGGVVASVADVGGRVHAAVGGVLVDASGQPQNATPPPRNGTGTGAGVEQRQPAEPLRPQSVTMTLKEAQLRLNQLGFKAGPVDGALGRQTIDALKRFQHSVGIQPTGNLDPATAEALQVVKRSQ